MFVGAGDVRWRACRKWAREGRKPFGYYEDEAAALERIQALRKEGLGFERIARVRTLVTLRQAHGASQLHPAERGPCP